MSQRAELKLSNEMLSEQIESEKTHYAALVDQYETARSLRHDIANHMYTIQALLSSGDTEQAAKYAAEIIPRHTFSSTKADGQLLGSIAGNSLWSIRHKWAAFLAPLMFTSPKSS